MIANQIITLLTATNTPYRVLPHDRPVFTVEDAVLARGVDAREMVKSILLKEKGGSRFVMACVAGPDRLVAQKVRAQLDGWKRLTFAAPEEISAQTGYIKGAVAPLCLSAEIPVFIDRKLVQCEQVNISSGDPEAGLELALSDLIRLVSGRIFDLTGDL